MSWASCWGWTAFPKSVVCGQLAALSLDDGPKKWAGLLSRDWLEGAGTGRRPVRRRACSPLSWQPDRAAQTLCLPAAAVLRGTTDYWVNDALGQPFFAVERPIDLGFWRLRSDIVPRLLKDVPGQPTVESSRPTAIGHAS